MCWSGEASLGMTAIGLTGALYARRKGHPPAIWVSILYFSGMEFIQAMTYPVIGECGNPLNKAMTNAGYTHIAFQSFFINWIGLSFMPEKVRKKWFLPAMILSAITALWYLAIAFYEPIMTTLCTEKWFCAEQTCSVHGNWHIAWQLRLSWIHDYWGFYNITAFALPVLYGSWRWSIFHLITGPIAARITTDNKFEIAAVWCLFSIGFLIAMEIPAVWRWLNTERIKVDGDTKYGNRHKVIIKEEVLKE
jgi:desulfoferrodoxin (superoxide reductase-like protein)